MTASLSEGEIAALQAEHYDATLVRVVEVHEDLRILRVRPDDHAPGFEPGQYTTLGLGNWEPRVQGVDEEELTPEKERRLPRRAYSFSCPMLDDDGNLVAPSECDFLEFYVVLVRHGEENPPGLTPRLFALNEGDRLHVGHKSTGHYTLAGVESRHDVVLISTGTGEAPHTAMVAELLHRGHEGRIVCLTCVRRRADLGYAVTFRRLEQRYPNVKYLALTTREPENLDSTLPNFVGKRYLQDYVADGDFEQEADVVLDPDRVHVFLCGNPSMIGPPVKGAVGADRYPKPRGMIETLESRGFRSDERDAPGNVHYEKYW